MRVIDEAFPADRSTGFFKIHPHHHKDVFCHFICQRFQSRGIVNGSVRVMDRTRSHHDHQSVVGLLQNRLNDHARRIHMLSQGPFRRQLCNERLRHYQLAQILDAKIISVGGHHLLPLLPMKLSAEGYHRPRINPWPSIHLLQ